MRVPVHDGSPRVVTSSTKAATQLSRAASERRALRSEKKHHRIARGFRRQAVLFLIRPAEQIAGQVEGDDASAAVCERLAASHNPTEH